MVKQYLQRLQTLALNLQAMRKYTPYVLVFALGAGTTGATYEMRGSNTSPVDRAVSNMQSKLHSKTRSNRSATRLVERTLPTPIQAPGPRLEALGSSDPVRSKRSEAMRKAATNGDLVRVRELLAEKANIEVPDNEGRTPLYLAAMHAQSDVVRALIGAGADIDARTGAGDTPLMAAAEIGDPVIVHMLLEADASVDVKNKSGASARLLAKKKGHDIVYEFIVDETQRRGKQTSQVERVQSLLAKRGYKVGRPDGVMGSRTKKAIRQFQRRAKLRVDGKVTPQLIAALERKRTSRNSGRRSVKAPPRKPTASLRGNGRSQSANRLSGREAEQDQADSSGSGGGWLNRAANSVGSMLEEAKTTASNNAALCEDNRGEAWVQDGGGNWIECSN